MTLSYSRSTAFVQPGRDFNHCVSKKDLSSLLSQKMQNINLLNKENNVHPNIKFLNQTFRDKSSNNY